MKEEIIKKIRQNNPDPVPLEEYGQQRLHEEDLLACFLENLQKQHGTGIVISAKKELQETIDSIVESGTKVYIHPSFPLNIDSVDPAFVQSLDYCLLHSTIAVAENGAIWLESSLMPLRKLPFISFHLIVYVDASEIVPDMHSAYERLESVDHEYGVFIAGPSKTADIGQKLAIGAQGAHKMTVIVKKMIPRGEDDVKR